MSTSLRGAVVSSVAALATLTAWSGHVEAQQAGNAIGVADALAAPIAPLKAITVPDVNVLGVLDGQGPIAGAAQWIAVFGGPITNPNQRTALQAMGKALFWDMQVGGDGIQACATCHYHAGADNRFANQVSPGLKRTVGGTDVPASAADTGQDLLGSANAALSSANFIALNANGDPVGLPVSEAALIAAGSTPDEADGTSGVPGSKPAPALDVNDVVSSQGVRLGTYAGLSGGPVDSATLAASDAGFNVTFTSSVHTTARRVEPRNSPTAINAVYHMRNFWDGRADMFFNGVTPLGFRDTDSTVKVFSGGALSSQKLRIPFSSLASQAVGPIESDFEMVFAGRPHRDLGRKLLAAGVMPLAGQAVSGSDSLLGGLSAVHGLNTNYKTWIQDVFDERFWGDGSGNDVCLDASGNFDEACPVNGYTLMEWNFSLFFGLAVQAYEATLFTEETIVDLLVGGIATGDVRIDNVGRRGTTQGAPVNVTGLPLEGCIALVSQGQSAAAQGAATLLCTQHYSQFIHPDALAGSQADQTGFLKASGAPVLPNERIGGCAPGSRVATTVATVNRGAVSFSPACNTTTLDAAQTTLQSVDRGMGRFFAGATGCSICHFNPEFTGATVAALTGFGAAPLPPLPPGQLRRIPAEVPMERMVAFNGAPAVYDAGFYNLGVRPTPEDLSIGDQIGGVPLAFTKLAELIEGGVNGDTDPGGNYDDIKIAAIASEMANGALLIPTSATDLTPRPWALALACGPGLVGNGNGNNNPIPQCVPNVIPGERLLRNGAFKAQGLRMVKFTGPYFHNGSKMNLSEVVNFYETAGSMTTLNFNNLDAGLRIFNLGPTDTAAMIEMMETGLTDWRLAYEEGKFDHPQICVPHGHHPDTGATILVDIPAVGNGGNGAPLATFENLVDPSTRAIAVAHDLSQACSMGSVSTAAGASTVDVPPAPAP
jgi:cytochrome c peroxidase